MKRIKKYFTPIIAGAIILSLSSCTAPSANRDSDNTGLPSPETSNTPLASQLDANAPIAPKPQPEKPVAAQSSNTISRKATPTTKSTNTVTVNIYRADTQCQTLVPEKVAVPTNSPVDAAVGKVLEQAASGDFDLAGYRVSINPKTAIATVDLRLAPNSQRQFLSLSTCEQFALFGSLRKTLIDNSQLKIKDVRFTEQGQELEL